MNKSEIKDLIDRLQALPAEKQNDLIDYIGFLEWETDKEKRSKFKVIRDKSNG